jgi:HlyD family secretion protein
VEARVVLWEGTDVLALPASSVFRQGDGWAVFVVEDGVAQLRRIERGHHTGLAVEILSGLAPGESVVLYPNEHVADGTRVSER